MFFLVGGGRKSRMDEKSAEPFERFKMQYFEYLFTVYIYTYTYTYTYLIEL